MTLNGAETFLRANPDVQSFHVIWTDMCGVIRGKVLRRDEVVPLAAKFIVLINPTSDALLCNINDLRHLGM